MNVLVWLSDSDFFFSPFQQQQRAVVLGTLSAKSKVSVAVRFVALARGTLAAGNARVCDQQGDVHALHEPWQFLVV